MLWCVAGVVEQIVGVLALARSAWLVHAVTDRDSRGVGVEPGGRYVDWPFWFVVRVPRHCGVCIGVVGPWGHPCLGLWWKVRCGVGVVACFEVQYRPWCGGCVGVTGPSCARHVLGVVADRKQVLGGHMVFRYAPICAVVDDGGLRGFGLVWGQ